MVGTVLLYSTAQHPVLGKQSQSEQDEYYKRLDTYTKATTDRLKGLVGALQSDPSSVDTEDLVSQLKEISLLASETEEAAISLSYRKANDIMIARKSSLENYQEEETSSSSASPSQNRKSKNKKKRKILR
ncbi:unnamed protein product [Albugo candida]|uniref:Uncharacterized protein n=1 Tax=Albugo candida TaxID=65357 RepID=A0A024GDW5_9STRA|nr:unnamed protein product [Albugo candida]|eukprot:CCI44874.1 unnamed protein product [Albugo candida]